MAATAAQPIDLQAFELRAEFAEISGATTSYGDGKTFDIKGALDSGEENGPAGVIVVDALADEGLAAQLQQHLALKSIPVPDGVEAPFQEAADKRQAHNPIEVEPVGIDSIRAEQDRLGKSRRSRAPQADPAPTPEPGSPAALEAEEAEEKSTSTKRSGAAK